MNYKKAAMFGLCRALKKQSGGLFLASRHSVDSQETRGSFKTTRGAMFGLDARIALAIFGALSVISGAALYSAIQDAKVTSTLADINEIGKAYEQYYLDTGTPIEKFDTVNVKSANLVNNPSVTGWKGPYLQYSTGSGADSVMLKYPKISGGHTYYTKFEGLDFPSLTVLPAACSNIKDCRLYVMLREPVAGKTLENMAPKLSEKVDGNTNLLTGRLRAHKNSVFYYIFYYYMPAQEL